MVCSLAELTNGLEQLEIETDRTNLLTRSHDVSVWVWLLRLIPVNQNLHRTLNLGTRL